MGSFQSKEDVEAALQEEEDKIKKEFELSKEALKELDQTTRVPHLLIEIRSLGFVEVQGKDTGGIYERLGKWLVENWKVQEKTQDIVELCNEDQDCGCCGHSTHFDIQDLQEHHRLCEKSWTMGPLRDNGMASNNSKIYKARGYEGENNMGKLTMQLARFMTQECGWTLQVCDSGNLGYSGDIREQQMKFKAPHPLNMIAPLIMIELRQVGYIEVNGENKDDIFNKLSGFFKSTWKAETIKNDPDYCDLKFSTSAFHKRGGEGENNMGLRTMELVDFMVKKCQWTMVTCNTGNFGRKGDKREQQLIFRNDEFVQHGIDHLMVELRTVGYIEINGMHDAQDLQPHLIEFLTTQWGCKEYSKYFWESDEKYCDLKYTAGSELFFQSGLTNNLGRLTIQLAQFMAPHGWQLLLCNGGSMSPNPHHDPNRILREQQVKFTRAPPEKASAPLLLIELRTLPTDDNDPDWDDIIEICGPDTNGVHAKLHGFIEKYMGGYLPQYNPGNCDLLYICDKFRIKPSELHEDGRWEGYMNGESNLGKWTMRVCDFMVDHLGEWDLIVCNSDNLSRSFRHGSGDNKYYNSVTAREMQMIFRHRAGGRGVFMSAASVKPLGRPPLQPPPYWTDKGCVAGEVGHKIIPGTAEELEWMQEILDKTFKNKVTRDRKDGQPLADRFVAVQCLRSEHPELWDRYAERRKVVSASGSGGSNFVVPKTMAASHGMAQRCTHASVGNPANQAYLLHGTNPTSAVAILSNSFTVDFAGKSAGTMFGPGIYLAESSTKADEYARDDAGGEYDGLYALLVCKAVLGKSYVTEQPGDFREPVLNGEFGHVLGDREKAVGTFREFIFFHDASIYPEYAVFYRREKDGKIMPRPERETAPPVMEMEGV
eukprot:symbB.v1.2.032095.t1/scaffold3754.1/size70833/6